MKTSFGETVRTLRLERNLTQGQLADALNISPQAVSKWERGQALPDLSLIPALARALNVAVDALFGMDGTAREIDALREQAMALVESDPAESRRILNEGLRKYPAAPALLRAMLYAENYKTHPDDTLETARRLTACACDDSDRYDALRFTAYALAAKGDEAAALEAAESLPDLAFTRLTELAFLLHGEGKRKAAEKQARISLENLLQMLEQAAESDEAAGQTKCAIARREKALALLRIMQDEPYAAELTVYVRFFEGRLKKNAAEKGN